MITADRRTGHAPTVSQFEHHLEAFWQNIAASWQILHPCACVIISAEVAQASIPFTSCNDREAFLIVLDWTVESGLHPAGFGLEEEWVSIESYITG